MSNRQFNNAKRSLSFKENIKSWKRGQKRKIIAEPSNKMATASRNGIILT